MRFENEVCTAYAFIEAGGTFEGYQALYKTETVSKADWRHVKKKYKKLAEYMTNEAIKQAKEYIIACK